MFTNGGWLVVPAVLLGIGTSMGICSEVFDSRHECFFMLVGFCLSAALVKGLDKLLDDSEVVIDRETGMVYIRRTPHALFGVPVRWWPYLLVVFGIGYYLSDGSL